MMKSQLAAEVVQIGTPRLTAGLATGHSGWTWRLIWRCTGHSPG